ncbi:hypothetical protein CKO28_22820 [Rhodovibrio sodomensis]|uniref:Helix-turn-helix domain-containing protein n=1 Tax=Rhodovibrio sodomensis TaxID=1088 RepID=A0ABS1DMA3_9PROT|nr:hypothetical protein [Rhodovibrio sodomensis]
MRFRRPIELAENHRPSFDLMPANLMTSRQAAEYLSISEATLSRLRQARELGYFMVGKRYRHSLADLDLYLEKTRMKPKWHAQSEAPATIPVEKGMEHRTSRSTPKPASTRYGTTMPAPEECGAVLLARETIGRLKGSGRRL